MLSPSFLRALCGISSLASGLWLTLSSSAQTAGGELSLNLVLQV